MSSPAPSNAEVRARWDTNAAFWDEHMAEGNAFHLHLVEPSALTLLALQPGERVLEIGCGNGQFARKLTTLGARVTATDFSAAMLERARAHTQPENARIDYRLVDATDEPALRALDAPFDAVVSNMALMDMPEIDPLFRTLPDLLTPAGRFVFCITHPCFNTAGVRFALEMEDRAGEIVDARVLRLSRYGTPTTATGMGIIGQPVPHYYFERPLHALFGEAFRASLILDGLLEPRFPPEQASPRWASWQNFHEFPPVLAARLRPAASPR